MCISVGLVLHWLIVLIVICAVFALLKLLVDFVLPRLGLAIAADIVAFFAAAIRIVIIAAILIAAVMFIGWVISCLWGYGLSIR